MGCNQHRSRKNARKESNIEERREKDRERKRKRKAMLRGEEISSQAIGIILNLCNFIFIDIDIYNLHFHSSWCNSYNFKNQIYNFLYIFMFNLIDFINSYKCNFIFHKIQFHSVRFHKFIDFILI